MYRSWLLSFVIAGCASRVSLNRAPAAVDMGAGYSESERAICSETDCHHLVAPCTLKGYSPVNSEPTAPLKALSQMEERYLKEMELLDSAGYCQFVQRALPNETYGRNSCLFVFAKHTEGCKKP